ncbi:MAG: glycosyltransferase family 61 protein [Deltaproteobacteria bacterium]
MADGQDNPPPQVDSGWSREIVTLKNALIAPPVDSGTAQQCGIYTEAGEWCPHGATWRGWKPMMSPYATPPEVQNKIAGRHVFCGQIWAHFGHWMAESMSRLWALDHLDEKPDGLIFMVKRPRRGATVHSYQKAFLDALGIDLPITIVFEATKVEELIVPGQGFGLGSIISGTPEFRDFMHGRLGKGDVPEGARKLYVSRSALGGKMGGLLLETVLEDNLRAAGYEIYHPQQHSLADQIAAYRAADMVLGPDGSALHLLGFVARPEQKIGVILRRNSAVAKGITSHIKGFTGVTPGEYNALSTDWLPKDVGRASRNSFGQLDFEGLQQMLIADGFITADDPWTVPNFRDQKRGAEAIGKARGLELESLHDRKRAARLARLEADRAASDAEETDESAKP